MIRIPSRRTTLAVLTVAAFEISLLSDGALLTSASGQAVDSTGTTAVPPPTTLQPQTAPATASSPSAADIHTSAGMIHTDANGRHLAPHDTFFLLSYVSAKTDKGVEGFPPGQEVHLVEVHRDTQTLVVTNGRAQIEVPPFKLTNDLDIAALVSRNDEASQARIAAHIQSEQEAYDKFQRQAADVTAKDLNDRKKEAQEAQQQAVELAKAKTDQQAAPSSTPANDNGYYGSNGYGYGSPFGYFGGGGGRTIVINPTDAKPASSAAPAAMPPARVTVPPQTTGGSRVGTPK